MIRSSTMMAGFALVAFTCGFVRDANADCPTRHFYNKSTAPFEIGMAAPGKCSISLPYMQSTCMVPAGGSAELHYPNQTNLEAAIAVRSADGGLVFQLTTFTVNINAGSCYINHQQSNTGNIVVNSDADGDITTCGASTYKCAQPAKDAVKIP